MEFSFASFIFAESNYFFCWGTNISSSHLYNICLMDHIGMCNECSEQECKTFPTKFSSQSSKPAKKMHRFWLKKFPRNPRIRNAKKSPSCKNSREPLWNSKMWCSHSLNSHILFQWRSCSLSQRFFCRFEQKSWGFFAVFLQLLITSLQWKQTWCRRMKNPPKI